MSDTPKFEDAPGVKVIQRKDGSFYVFWMCRTDLMKRGYKPPIIPLWRGLEPTEADRALVSDTCKKAQTDMLIWGRGGLPATPTYDGTVRGLIHCYKTDPDSPFHKLRFFTRQNYTILCRRIENGLRKDNVNGDETGHGDERIADIRPRDVMHWHEEWSASGIPMAHGLVRMFRGLLGFGMTMLEDNLPDGEVGNCERLSLKLSKMRFTMGKSREVELTAEQATAIRAMAHVEELHSIALAQAFQYECAFRQKDEIGEWVPLDEPGTSEITSVDKNGRHTKWLRGIRWSEIDEHLVLRHITSKKQKAAERELLLAPMVMEELTRLCPDLIIVNEMTKAVTINRHLLPASGPVIIEERTGLPYRAHNFRAKWRDLARAVGIPDHIRNMDSRAGAITEATDSGSLEDARHLAQYSDIQMTAKYSRGTRKKVSNTMRNRAEHRKNNSGTSGSENA